MNFEYFIPTKIYFGKGSISNLKKAKEFGNKAVIVTSGKSTTKFGYIEKIQNILNKNNIENIVYKKVTPNPTKENVEELVSLIKSNNCDFIIGLGGGSSIDTGKAASFMATNEGDLWDYIDDGTGKANPIKNEPLPLIAITTTSGTGTEADPWFVVTNKNTNEKIGSGCEKTFPKMSIVDPDFMMTVPKDLTAYQGFDALFHATEGYIANKANPISEMFSLKSIELISKYLPVAIKNGNNEEARTNVALANTLSGLVETLSCCTSEHALEHALSGFYPSLPHGAGLIMISKEYYKHFSKICPERLIKMAKSMGNENANKPEDFITSLSKLQKECNVENLKMSDYNIDPNRFEEFTEKAMNATSSLFAKDREKLKKEDAIKIFKNSYK